MNAVAVPQIPGPDLCHSGYAYMSGQTLDAVKVMAAELHAEIERMPEVDRPTLRKGAAKGIRFVPLNDLRRRFVTLDATDLGDILGFGDFGVELKNDMTRRCLAKAIKTVFGPNYARSPDDVTAGDGRPPGRPRGPTGPLPLRQPAAPPTQQGRMAAAGVGLPQPLPPPLSRGGYNLLPLPGLPQMEGGPTGPHAHGGQAPARQGPPAAAPPAAAGVPPLLNPPPSAKAGCPAACCICHMEGQQHHLHHHHHHHPRGVPTTWPCPLHSPKAATTSGAHKRR